MTAVHPSTIEPPSTVRCEEVFYHDQTGDRSGRSAADRPG